MPAAQVDFDNYRRGRIEPLAAVVMLFRILTIVGIGPILLLMGGCACPSAKCGVPRSPHLPCIYDLCECNQPPPDVAGELPAGDPVPLPAPGESYELVNAATCQCQAATNMNVANMVELERHWAGVIVQCDTENVAENLCLDRDLLSLHACQMRNEAAASALTAYYQLAGLEAQQHYLQQAVQEAERTLGRFDNLSTAGIGVPENVDRTTILGQINQLNDQLAQMQFVRLQLNGQLQTLLGCPLDEHCFFWPEMDWHPDLAPLDVEAELAFGLQNRHDLRGLELVLCNLEKISLPVARGVLKFADSTVGTVEPRKGLIHVLRCYCCNEQELPIRCRQLALFYDETETKATGEIKNAAYKIGLQQQRVLIAQRRVLELRGRLDELTKTRDINDVAIFRISRVQGEMNQAEAELIEQLVALEIARVELKKAQSILSDECGFQPKLCLEGCCNGACMRCGCK